MDLIVRNIPEHMGTYGIKHLFRKHGVVKRVQRQEGSLYINMPNPNEAMQAVKAINGMHLLGCQLEVLVNENKSPTNRQG